MRRVTVLLSLLSLVLLASHLGASDGAKADFDQGIDSTGIIEFVRAQRNARRAPPRMPVAEPKAGFIGVEMNISGQDSLPTETSEKRASENRIKGPLPLPDTVPCDGMPPSQDNPEGATVPSLCGVGKSKAVTLVDSAAFAPVTGPYELLVTDSTEFKQGLVLKERLDSAGEAHQLSLIPNPVRNALRNQWAGIEAQRAELQALARPLDRDDQSLHPHIARLDGWAAKLRSRAALLNSHWDEYERLCLGRDLPENEFNQCYDFWSRMRACNSDHRESAAVHEAQVQDWYRSKECIKTRGDSFREKVKNWIRKILVWIGLASAALDGELDCARDRLGRPTPGNGGVWFAHCSYTCEDFVGECGIPALWDHHPTLDEHETKCPVVEKRPTVQCPAPWLKT